MKYMTFNNSCSYAGVANMLEDFNINIEDYELAIRMRVPFILNMMKRASQIKIGCAKTKQKWI